MAFIGMNISYGISMKCKSGIVNRNEIEIMRVRLS